MNRWSNQLAEAQYQVAVKLGGVAKGWRFDRMATVVHPGSGMVTASYAPIAKHFGGPGAAVPPLLPPCVHPEVIGDDLLQDPHAEHCGGHRPPPFAFSPHRCRRRHRHFTPLRAPVITAGRFGLIVSADHSAIISGARDHDSSAG